MSLIAIQKKIAMLTAQMEAAVTRDDFETAARLRDEIVDLRGVEVRQPPPGQMGLGTNIPVAEPPKGWKRPKKPDLMTTTVKSRKR